MLQRSDILRSFLAIGVLLLPALAVAQSPGSYTADRPDAWLVLYNTNSRDSAQWALWYAGQRGIPLTNLVGLAASTDEHLPDLLSAKNQVFEPVQQFLNANPQIAAHIMGIIAGYGVPGHFGSVAAGGPGGNAIVSGLQDLTDDVRDVNQQNPQLTGWTGTRLTKGTLLAGHYLVGRIDAPSLALAQALTTRALAIADPNHYVNTEYVYYDYQDPFLQAGEWIWLRQAVESPLFPEVPWQNFDDDADQTPNDAFRLGAHSIVGWGNARLYGVPAGSRILAYNFNSYGATTVRSTTAEGGRYVPNAINAGYAAALGATAEPSTGVSPYPWVLLAALREGWTLGEALYLASPYDDWVWIGVGDPLLRMAHWFDETHLPLGDMDCNGALNSFDIDPFVQALINPSAYAAAHPGCPRSQGDVNRDGVFNFFDVDAFVGLLLGG